MNLFHRMSSPSRRRRGREKSTNPNSCARPPKCHKRKTNQPNRRADREERPPIGANGIKTIQGFAGRGGVRERGLVGGFTTTGPAALSSLTHRRIRGIRADGIVIQVREDSGTVWPRGNDAILRAGAARRFLLKARC